MTEIRVLLAEDQTLMRQGLRTILELSQGMYVVGEAANGAEAVAQARQLQPDIVLMDVQMPVLDGVGATAQIVQQCPNTHVILLTTFDYDDYVFNGMKVGARGYLLKDAPSSMLLDTIRRVHAGECIVQPSIAVRLITELGQRHSESPATDPLSEREQAVLHLLADGMSNREIAIQLVLAEGTVKNYVSSILDKLHASNRTHATRIAREQGLLG